MEQMKTVQCIHAHMNERRSFQKLAVWEFNLAYERFNRV